MFLIPIIVMGVAQIMKFGRYTFKHGLDWEYMFSPGHFPSAHSAFVTSLLVCIGYYDSVTSPAFAVAAAFAMLTIYDAMRVRVNIGIQGRVINTLVEKLDDLDEIDKKMFPHLKERVGHYASEVAGGITVGIVVTFLFIWLIEHVIL